MTSRGNVLFGRVNGVFSPHAALIRRAIVVVVGGFALAAPSLLSGYSLHVLTELGIFIPLALGQNLLTGNGGQISLGHAAFFGVGAYSAGIIAARSSVDTVWVLLVASAAGGLGGLLVGLPSLRVRGDYLFVVSLGFNFIFLDFANSFLKLTGGAAGLPGVPSMEIAGHALVSPADVYYAVLFIAVLMIVVTVLVVNSRFGRALEAARDDIVGSQAFGINAGAIRVWSFVIAGCMAGVAGALSAYFIHYVGPGDFGLEQALIIFEMVVIGGLGSVPGSIIGCAILIVLPEVLRPLVDYRAGIGGAIVLAMMLWRPQGIMGKVRLTAIAGGTGRARL
jgi:branched-chain amino acid transport system permease protein